MMIVMPRDATPGEEMLASIIGSLLVTEAKEQESLIAKAVEEALKSGIKPTDAVWLVDEIRLKLENWL
jgi:hypothetical protein